MSIDFFFITILSSRLNLQHWCSAYCRLVGHRQGRPENNRSKANLPLPRKQLYLFITKSCFIAKIYPKRESRRRATAPAWACASLISTPDEIKGPNEIQDTRHLKLVVSDKNYTCLLTGTASYCCVKYMSSCNGRHVIKTCRKTRILRATTLMWSLWRHHEMHILYIISCLSTNGQIPKCNLHSGQN